MQPSGMPCLQDIVVEIRALHVSQERQATEIRRYLKEIKQDIAILKEAVGAGGSGCNPIVEKSC